MEFTNSDLTQINIPSNTKNNVEVQTDFNEEEDIDLGPIFNEHEMAMLAVTDPVAYEKAQRESRWQK